MTRQAIARADLDRVLTLSRDRELVTCERHTPNDFYGHAASLKRYAGLAPDQPLAAVVEHAPFDPAYAWEVDLQADMPLYLAFSGSRLAMLRERGVANPQAIGPLIHYAHPSFSPEEIAAERKRLGRNLLVFPSHSSHKMRLEWDAEKLCCGVEKAAKNFDSVRICLFWKDILNGAATSYLQYDWELVTAGHMFDPAFGSRLKSLLLTADVTMACEWGTHIGYSLYLDRPVFLHHVPYVIHLDEGEAVQPHDPIRKETMDLFREWKEEITPRQRQLVGDHWGFDHVRSPKELREMLLAAAQSGSTFQENRG